MPSSSYLECLRDLSDVQAYVPKLPPGVRVRLDANEAPPLRALGDVVSRAVARVALERYPDARAAELKDAIALRTGAPPASLVVGSGSDELIALLATACARPRGRDATVSVVVPTPTFVMYRTTSRTHGLRVVDVPLDAAFDLDTAAMSKAVALLSPNLVFIASPNNPTGNRMSLDRIESVARAAADAIVVLDEAYVDYTEEGSMRALLRERFPNVAVLRTLSKVGLAALRVGWIEADEAVAAALDKTRQPFNVSSTSQAAATAVLRDAWPAVTEHVAAIVAERDRVARALAGLRGIAPQPTEANFVWVRTERPAEEVHAALLTEGVLVRGFASAGGRMAHHLRVTIGTREENDALLHATEKVCA